MTVFHNPILPGFYPDPSIVRAGEDYYLVTSTFEYFPGLPIFHSRDLVHWKQIGHVLDRPSQLNLDGLRPSRGLYAPTIRFHNGTFYVINTLVTKESSTDSPANFIVTTQDPAGDWSDPIWLDGAPGIDPSLFFDADGRVWYTGNRVPEQGESYTGCREIWLQELDLRSMQLIGEPVAIWEGALHGAKYVEAPHIYRFGDMYYLLTSEGGTGENHAVVVARSSSVTGPYEACPHNPIMTHRHMGRSTPIIGTGHADFVETQRGEWWVVLLAMRPYSGQHYNLGRETFLAPVQWMNGWPLISPETGKIEFQYNVPDLAPADTIHPSMCCDHFESPQLDLCWNFIRTPREVFWSLAARPGFLRLLLRPEQITEWVNPSFIGRRQQHMYFYVSTAMEFAPANEHECAGIVILQNDGFHFRLVITRVNEERVALLIRREAGHDTVCASLTVKADRVYLRVVGHGQFYSFYAAEQCDQWLCLAKNKDGRILSTSVAGGFVGAYIGMYASSCGMSSQNYADWDWFEYQSL